MSRVRRLRFWRVFFLSIAGILNAGFPEGSRAQTGEHVLEMVAVNFIEGELDNAQFAKMYLTISGVEGGRKIVLRKNDKVELSAFGDSGKIRFRASDLATGSELHEIEAGPEGHVLKLGSAAGVQRFGFQNPYGYTAVLVEEVTDIDPGILEEWNRLTHRMTSLLNERCSAKISGVRISPEVEDEIRLLNLRLEQLRSFRQSAR